MNKVTLTKKIKTAVKQLVEDNLGCFTFKLDDRLAICVGWSKDYDTDDPNVIHSNTDLTWGINVGIKVWTSDSLLTDYDFINSPYYENDEVWDTDCTISPKENYETLVDYLLEEYAALSKFEIEKDGKIVGHKNLWVCEHCLQAIESREGAQITCAHSIDEETPVPCDWCEEIGFDTLYELI